MNLLHSLARMLGSPNFDVTLPLNVFNLAQNFLGDYQTETMLLCKTFPAQDPDTLGGLVENFGIVLFWSPQMMCLLLTCWHYWKMFGMLDWHIMKFCNWNQPNHTTCHVRKTSADMSVDSFRTKEKIVKLCKKSIYNGLIYLCKNIAKRGLYVLIYNNSRSSSKTTIISVRVMAEWVMDMTRQFYSDLWFDPWPSQKSS